MGKPTATDKRWKYSGDISIRHGGYYWRNDGWSDYVLVVRVTPFSDAGGNDNEFWVEEGSLYIPDDKPQEMGAAFSCCGIAQEELNALTPVRRRRVIVDCLIAYRGFDIDTTHNVRIGPAQPECREGPFSADTFLRANSSLRNWVRRNCLGYAS